jgi:hypothetical protein
MIRDVYFGSRIQGPGFLLSRISDPEVKKATDIGSATLVSNKIARQTQNFHYLKKATHI